MKAFQNIFGGVKPMNQPDDVIRISHCPECGKPHSYQLQVKRSVHLGHISFTKPAELPRKVRFVRLFTCPEKETDFQATVVLTETFSNQIEKVEVAGVTSEETTNE